MTFDEWLISRLRAHGAYTGATDGVHGRALIEALKKFQTAQQIPVTGTANNATVAALRKDASVRDSGLVLYETAPSIPAEPVWLREARRFMGLNEIAGSKSNPTIMGWAKKIGGWVASYYTNDDTPWCGLFVAHCVGATLPAEVLPSNPLSALAWGKIGRHLAIPSVGAVMAFTRTGGGHVGFYVGEDRTHYHILGGNQQNSVSITRIEKSRLAATRWPTTGTTPVDGRVHLTAAGVPVTKNEV